MLIAILGKGIWGKQMTVVNIHVRPKQDHGADTSQSGWFVDRRGGRDRNTRLRPAVVAQIKKAIGNVPNTFAAIGAHVPAALKAVLAADAVLASGPLSDF
jgi:hypothetical protein